MEENSDKNFLKKIRDCFHDMEFSGKQLVSQSKKTVVSNNTK